MPPPELRFVHEDPDFAALLRIIGNEVGVQEALVEKDYWVTHALWALETVKFRVHLRKAARRFRRALDDVRRPLRVGVR